MKRFATVWAGASLLLTLAACGFEKAEPVESPASVARPPTTLEAVPPPGAPSAPARAGLVLGAGTVGAVDLTTGSTRLAEFGTARERVVALVSAVYRPVSEEGRLEECGEGPVDFVAFGPGLTAYFQNGVLSGWAARKDESLGTMTGVRVGMTRADLEQADRAVTIERSTLGEEFTSEGVSGLLDGSEPTARVETIWDGTACVFR